MLKVISEEGFHATQNELLIPHRRFRPFSCHHSGTRISRHERASSAGCFRRRVLIRACRQTQRRAEHQNRYQLDSMFFKILNFLGSHN